VPRHELVDAALRPAVDQPGQQVGEIDLRVDAVQLARLDQRRQVGPAASAIIARGKKCVLSAQDQRSDGAFDGVRMCALARRIALPGENPGRQTLAPAGSTRGGSGGDEWSEALREKVPSGDQRAIRAAAQANTDEASKGQM